MTFYLDHAATTPLRPSARHAWWEASERVGNPSSLHGSGRAARALLEDARERVAAALGAHPTEVIFTSGATESNNLAIKGAYWARSAAEAARVAIVTTPVEHHAALDPARWLARAQGARLVEVGVNANAVVDMEGLADALAGHAGEVALVSVQWVNNEVGTVQPMDDVVALADRAGVPVHSDAVQGIGHLPFSFAESALATAAVSGHKVGAPVGIGLLLARRGAELVPLTHGGGQERRVRSGTLDAAGAWALATALDDAVASLAADAERLAPMAGRLASAIVAAAPHAVIHAHGAPHIVHAIIPGARSEGLLLALDAAGIDASPGAACTAGVIEPSHVVAAMGYSEADASCTLRLSLGWSTTDSDIDAAIGALPGAIVAAQRASGA